VYAKLIGQVVRPATYELLLDPDRVRVRVEQQPAEETELQAA
jgi:hypothetical protein